MQGFVNDFIAVDSNTKKDILLVKRLLELIECDKSINDSDEFYISQDGKPILKSELRSISDICLPAFLLGIWHFIIQNRKDNSIGAATIDSWHEPQRSKSKTGGATREFISDIGEKIAHKINFVDIDEPISSPVSLKPDTGDVEVIPVNDCNTAQVEEGYIKAVENTNLPIIDKNNLADTVDVPIKNEVLVSIPNRIVSYMTTFKENLGEVINENDPIKTYHLYEQMYFTLIYEHDMNKNLSYALKTGLTIQGFIECLSEFCYLACKDDKYEMSKEEFVFYFKKLKTENAKVNIDDFIHDACFNVCFMFYNDGQLQFLHRSLQEYFVARHFNEKLLVLPTNKKKKIKFHDDLITYFERRCRVGDITLNMLIEMNLSKVEKFIYVPFLEGICDKFKVPVITFEPHHYITEIKAPISALYRYILHGAGFPADYDVSIWYDDEEAFSNAYKAMRKYFTDIQNRLKRK
jgi:hypothetical protein